MIGVIGGSGLEKLIGAQVNRRHNVTSKYGPASDAVLEIEANEQTFLFLPRHAEDHRLPPHLVNYRANVWALHTLGVTEIFSVNAVGGINPDFGTGNLVIPDQIIDYTHCRDATFFDGISEPLKHTDFTEPYTKESRMRLFEAASQTLIREIHHGGVYGCTQGPRLETAAEISRMARDGCDLVGMTAMPEAILARELGIDYAAICMVVNPAAGLSEDVISIEAIEAECRAMAADVSQILYQLICPVSEG